MRHSTCEKSIHMFGVVRTLSRARIWTDLEEQLVVELAGGPALSGVGLGVPDAVLDELLQDGGLLEVAQTLLGGQHLLAVLEDDGGPGGQGLEAKLLLLAGVGDAELEGGLVAHAALLEPGHAQHAGPLAAADVEVGATLLGAGAAGGGVSLDVAGDVGPGGRAAPGLVLDLRVIRQVADLEGLVPGEGHGRVRSTGEVALGAREELRGAREELLDIGLGEVGHDAIELQDGLRGRSRGLLTPGRRGRGEWFVRIDRRAWRQGPFRAGDYGGLNSGGLTSQFFFFFFFFFPSKSAVCLSHGGRDKDHATTPKG
ncbi:hypothetical protein VTK73DRAFT_5771 [Phialemonium thermophilum]|uniref:Uncharacterized protein n=1 Tax=Phialemonium thermophilum TaxID=223376 RepID=A0ABR3V0S8_9PEZI